MRAIITTYLSAQIPAIERAWANGPTSPRAKYSPGDVAHGAEAELWVEQLQELCRGSRPGIGDRQVEAPTWLASAPKAARASALIADGLTDRPAGVADRLPSVMLRGLAAFAWAAAEAMNAAYADVPCNSLTWPWMSV